MTTLDVATIHLDKGSHACDNGGCLFEYYNLLRGEKKTDKCPADVSLVLHGLGINLNDSWDDEARQQLKRFLPHDGVDPLAGTRDGRDEERSYLALDWLIRTYTPAWLDLADLTAEAQSLRDLRRIVDLVAADAAAPVVRDVHDKASAAESAAESAARSAAESAARSAAESAAWSAAESAARSAAWSAAWSAAESAARSAAWSAAESAAWSAAESAAESAARSALKPTVLELQASALDLFERMTLREQVAS